MQSALALGSPSEGPFTKDAVYFEYTRAANPIADGAISSIPARKFGAELYAAGPSRVVPLDLSADLGMAGPATGPGLCSNFIRIEEDGDLGTKVNATSQLFFVIRGAGYSLLGTERLDWSTGDYITLPAGTSAEHHATSDSALYWVHDEPLMTYLGAKATEPRFSITKYPHADAEAALEQVASDPQAAERSRVSILLANRAFDRTLTVTHVLWAMYGILPAESMQPLHRHQSIALDFVVDCEPGCFTLLGDLDGERLVNIERIDWEPGAAFVTPPGRWHSHHNESGKPAHIIPIQDAGLQTYLRTLDIRFMNKAEAERAIGSTADISPANSMHSAA
jgi:gentisate 1,2-dioxygenase